jgi:hypothetical protein
VDEELLDELDRLATRGFEAFVKAGCLPAREPAAKNG